MGEAIDDLPPRLREPIRLHYYQEKSYPEIAFELGISYGNVRKRMSQARAILREKLSGFVREEDGVPPQPRKGGKSKKGTVAAPAVGESLPWVLPVGSGAPVGAAALYALQGEPASFEPSAEGELGIVAGSEAVEAAVSVAPASGESCADKELGIVAGGFPPTGLSVVPMAPAQGETCLDLELGIAAGGEPLLGWTILAGPPPHLLAGCGTGGRTGVPPVLRRDMGTGGRTGGRPVLRQDIGTGGTRVLHPEMGTRGGTGGTPVLRREVGASVWDGHLGQKEPHAGVREMRWLLGLCWRLWADSGGAGCLPSEK